MKVDVTENWIGPANVQGPTEVTVDEKYLINISHECGGVIDCDTPVLPLNGVTYNRKIHREWKVRGQVSVEASASLRAPMIARLGITGGFEVEGEYGGHTTETISMTVGDGLEIQPCTTYQLRVSESKQIVTGTIREAEYRVLWCNSCACGDAAETFCNLKTGTGSAEKGLTLNWDSKTIDCGCVDCCEE